MSYFKWFFASISFVFLLQNQAFAQKITIDETALVSTWWGTVAGDAQPRILKIRRLIPKENGYSVDALYGLLKGQTAVEAELANSEDGVKLNFTTGADSKISATQKSPTVFEGSFVLKNGASTSIRLEKVSDVELAAKIDEMKDPFRTIPKADVPAECASWFGLWGGTFRVNIGTPSNEGRLWVTGVDAGCKIRFAYVTTTLTDMPSGAVKTAEIKDGKISFTCGLNGTCVFEKKEAELILTYNNAQGGSNGSTFRKVAKR